MIIILILFLILILLLILYITNYSIEKFNTNQMESRCGSSTSLLDTSCNTYINNLNIIRNSGNPFNNKQASNNIYDIYINSSTNIPIIRNAVNKLYIIKSTIEELIKLEKLKKYINAIIYAYNNNTQEYNLEIANTPLNPITDSYSILNALTDAVILFTNTVNNPVYNKYKLSMPKYSLANLTTIQSLINTDYDEKIRIKETEKEEYNTIIKENISTMILTGIDSNFMINSLSNTLNGLNNTFTRTDIIRNLNTLNTLLSYYINSNINYKKAITFETKQLLRIIPLLKNVEQSFINYSKAKVGISQTIDPALLNIEYIIH
jgi:hypothetical protein